MNGCQWTMELQYIRMGGGWGFKRGWGSGFKNKNFEGECVTYQLYEEKRSWFGFASSS